MFTPPLPPSPLVGGVEGSFKYPGHSSRNEPTKTAIYTRVGQSNTAPTREYSLSTKSEDLWVAFGALWSGVQSSSPPPSSCPPLAQVVNDVYGSKVHLCYKKAGASLALIQQMAERTAEKTAKQVSRTVRTASRLDYRHPIGGWTW